MTAFSSLCRRFQKYPGQFSIAIGGLSLAWICSIAIGVHLYREFTYDHFHRHADRIYRVTHNEKAGEIPGIRHVATVGPPMGPGLKEEFPQVEDFARFRRSADWVVRAGGIQHYEKSVSYADPSVFKVFSFELMDGNPATALSLPENVVVTRSIALKYFGAVDVLGRQLEMNGKLYEITGVLKDLPSNSHLQFDFLLPFRSFTVPHGYPVTLESWGWISFHTYVLLRPGEDAAALEKQLPSLVKKHWSEERAKKFRLELQPLKDIYFGDVSHEDIPSGNYAYAGILALGGIAVLLVAAFNFANIFMVLGMARAREISIRKVFGSKKMSLHLSFHRESFVVVGASLFIAILIFPFFEPLLPWKAGLWQLSGNGILYGAFVLLAAAIAIASLASLYPARVLLGARLQLLLKGSFKTGALGRSLRRAVAVAQFCISIGLICCVLVITSQLDYLKSKELGFKKEELLLLHVPGDDLPHGFPLLQQQLLTNPSIAGVSVGGGRLDGDNGSVPIFTETTGDDGLPMAIDAVGFGYFSTIGIEPIAGREFTESFAADTIDGVIINESAMKVFGWTAEEALGRKIRVGDIVREGKVIGVMPDFHFASLHERVGPLVMSYPRTRLQDVYIRFDARQPEKAVEGVKAVWKNTFPNLPLDYSFMNDHLMSLYNRDRHFSAMVRFFSIIAVFIACLGLYAVISQDVIYRTREIGIRKALGESGKGIALLFLRDTFVFVVIANLLAWPIAGMLMSSWLDEFSYRIALEWYLFPLAGAAVLVLAIISVVALSVKAARINPAHCLRSE